LALESSETSVNTRRHSLEEDISYGCANWSLQ